MSKWTSYVLGARARFSSPEGELGGNVIRWRRWRSRGGRRRPTDSRRLLSHNTHSPDTCHTHFLALAQVHGGRCDFELRGTDGVWRTGEKSRKKKEEEEEEKAAGAAE